MGRKKKYENAEIIKEIISREFEYKGNLKGSITYRFLDLRKKEDRAFLRENIKDLKIICEEALKELEG